jgi:hypothetical protein
MNLEEVFSTNEHLYHRTDIDDFGVCGEGSQMDNSTKNLRENLYEFLKKWNIESIFDAPCGDFWWMRHIDLKNIAYLGGEIQTNQINKLNKNFPQKKFIRFDITQDSFPICDLWFSRDIFFHLSFEHKMMSFKNFVNSEIKYILMSNHVGFTHEVAEKFNSKVNVDTISGGFSHANFFLEPFNFELPLDSIDDNYDGHNKKNMILYSRKQIEKFINNI